MKMILIIFFIFFPIESLCHFTTPVFFKSECFEYSNKFGIKLQIGQDFFGSIHSYDSKNTGASFCIALIDKKVFGSFNFMNLAISNNWDIHNEIPDSLKRIPYNRFAPNLPLQYVVGASLLSFDGTGIFEKDYDWVRIPLGFGFRSARDSGPYKDNFYAEAYLTASIGLNSLRLGKRCFADTIFSSKFYFNPEPRLNLRGKLEYHNYSIETHMSYRIDFGAPSLIINRNAVAINYFNKYLIQGVPCFFSLMFENNNLYISGNKASVNTLKLVCCLNQIFKM